ncbi:unnamed protein product, partial [Laminaria digitata]
QLYLLSTSAGLGASIRSNLLRTRYSPIMLGYFKRTGDQGATSEGGGSAPPKRPRTSQQALSSTGDSSPKSPSPLKDPLTIVTWNANGLGVRMGKNWTEFQEFMSSVKPDVCCIQETRLAAAGFPNCKKDEDRGRRRGQMK